MLAWRKIRAMFFRPKAPSQADKGEKQDSRRRAPRKAQRLAQGYIWYEGMANSQLCSIRNISDTGARIDLLTDQAKGKKVAETLTLFLPNDQREVDCEVVWRAGSSVGLRFNGPFRSPTRRYGT